MIRRHCVGLWSDVLCCTCAAERSAIRPLQDTIATKAGGMLGHAASIARKRRAAWITTTGEATAQHVDGQLVRVDGDRCMADTHRLTVHPALNAGKLGVITDETTPGRVHPGET